MSSSILPSPGRGAVVSVAATVEAPLATAPERPAAPLVRHNGAARDDSSGEIYAALDLGTNNCRLLVARASSGSFRVIDAFSRIVRLGEGIAASGLLSEAAILRTLDALKICA